jgi:hypothetical protein
VLVVLFGIHGTGPESEILSKISNGGVEMGSVITMREIWDTAAHAEA